jgi:hypothetical protein
LRQLCDTDAIHCHLTRPHLIILNALQCRSLLSNRGRRQQRDSPFAGSAAEN